MKDKRAFPQLPKTRDELEAQLLQSMDRLDRGEGIDGEEVFRKLYKRIEEFGNEVKKTKS